jgi:muramidase (phage lysozyme)
VRKDPNTAGTADDVASQTTTMIAIRDAISAAARTINAAESVRSQLAAWRLLVGASAPKDVVNAADDLEKQIVEVESRLFNMTATGRGQDFLRTPSQLVEKLSHLADVVSYADFAPTSSQIEVRDQLAQELAHDREQMDGLFARPLANFNAALREHQLGTIVVIPSK